MNFLTKNMSSQNDRCEKCGEEYTSVDDKWCKPCHINCLKNLVRWSKNKKMNDFIQDMQLQINRCNDIVFWIPYNQFNNIKKMDEGNFSAIWEDGPLNYITTEKYERSPNKEVTLKCLDDSQNKFLKKVQYVVLRIYP